MAFRRNHGTFADEIIKGDKNMYTASATSKNKVVPFWNEIKTWSREDRTHLVELISESLEDDTPNQEIDSFLSGLDENLMSKATECIHKQYLAGKCTPYTKVMSHIEEKFYFQEIHQ